MAEGTIGAGTGATVAKTKGFEAAVKSGIGSAVVRLPEGPLVAAAVAVNAYGGVYDYQSGQVVAGPRKAGGYGFEDTMEHLLQYGIPDESPSPEENPSLENTSIGLVATDAQLTKEEANYLARVSHDGLALTIRPCHTDRDGDTMFALATGDYSQGVNLTRLGAAAVEATAQAVLRAVRTATGLGGLPAVGEVPGA
jgi:L-aminopeptidase/D-esterase-like protein